MSPLLTVPTVSEVFNLVDYMTDIELIESDFLATCPRCASGGRLTEFRFDADASIYRCYKTQCQSRMIRIEPARGELEDCGLQFGEWQVCNAKELILDPIWLGYSTKLASVCRVPI